MIDLFRVEKLDELTKDHFAVACVAAMSEDEELTGLLGVPCGSDYLLYEGMGKSSVKVRNWSSMLELHVVSESGTWLVSSHIDGRGIDGVIEEAWRQLESAMPYIKKQCKKAFTEQKLADGTVIRWMDGCEKYIERIKEVINGDE